MEPIPVEELKVKIFADGADKSVIMDMYARPWIKGFTTNPTLMRKAGIIDYRTFAAEILEAVTDRPISFEVFSDEFSEMETQALEISSWGENVYVKIPVTNTRQEKCYNLIKKLVEQKVKLNVTALMAIEQVREVLDVLDPDVASYISVFAGRIADTGRDPVPIMADAVGICSSNPSTELIWASPRELFNIFQANAIGCHIITATNDILNKISLVGKDLHEFSLDTVKMFYRDAIAANYEI